MKVTVIPIVVGILGTILKKLVKGLEDIGIRGQVETIQTTVLLRSARILRNILETWGDFLSHNPQWKTTYWRWYDKPENKKSWRCIRPFSSQRWRWLIICVKEIRMKKTYKHCVDAKIQRLKQKCLGRLITATRNNTDNVRINKNNEQPKIGRKTILLILQNTNKRNFTRENLDEAKKGRP